MSFVKCYDVAEMVLDEASKQFAPLFRENAERKQILKSYCEVIDSLAEEFNAESFDVEVDDIKMTISIKMECPDITITSENHPLYELAGHAVSVHFSNNESDLMVVEFVFPSIWEKSV